MRYVVLILIGVALTCVLIMAADDAALEAFDPLHPATLVPIVTSGFHDLESLACAFLERFTGAP